MLNRLYGWYGKRVVWGVIGVIVALLLAVIGFVRNGEDEVIETSAQVPTVTLRTVADLQSQSGFSVVGTVRAMSEAKLEAEAGGRITNVAVSIGDRVSAGMVLARIENSREGAALLQAQGAYESALASSRGSGVSLDEARIGAYNMYRTAYTGAESVVRDLVDDFFSSPNSGIVGFKLDGKGKTPAMNATYREIDSMLAIWSDDLVVREGAASGAVLLDRAEANVSMVNAFLGEISLILADEDPNALWSEDDLNTYATKLTAARASLDGTLGAISRARQTLLQAEVAAGSGTPSQSDALVKSAQGALRAAEANYEKTLVRTPISGVVNALYLVEGDYVNAGAPAAIVANNGSLEVTTALGESDLESVTVGDLVSINGSVEGTITKIAPAVDPLTGKAEVQVGVTNPDTLKNGSVVTVMFTRGAAEETKGAIVLPLSALKLLPSGPVAFGVNEDGTLVAYSVLLGEIMGDTVEVIEGLTRESQIVTDARGLRAGDVVEITE